MQSRCRRASAELSSSISAPQNLSLIHISMSGLETDTIGGFNSMIEKQKKENGEALISTVPVSYTHLDVYKRQVSLKLSPAVACMAVLSIL